MIKAQNLLKIYCDGGARGNPGPAASAFVVEKDSKVIHQESKFLGKTTNNVAEYEAVVSALSWLEKKKRSDSHIKATDEIEIVLDSELVAKQMAGLFKVKNENLKLLFLKAKQIERSLAKKIIYTRVGRERNKLADFLVNVELDKNQ